MSTDKTLKIVSTSSDVTEQLGAQLGKRLRGGEVIELVSDLGGGKTTLVRGIARGASSTDHVASPSFTLSKVYKTPRFAIHHLDFHRLNEPGVMSHELNDLLNDPKVVTIIEWSDIVKHLLPQKRLTIEINKTSEDEREFYFVCDSALEYLL